MPQHGQQDSGAVVAAPEAAGSPKVDDMGMDLNDFAFRQSNGQSEYVVGILVYYRVTLQNVSLSVSIC